MRYRGRGQRPRDTTSPKWCAASSSTWSGSWRRDKATPTQGTPRGPGTAWRGAVPQGLLADPRVTRCPCPLLVARGFGCIRPPVVERLHHVLPHRLVPVLAPPRL